MAGSIIDLNLQRNSGRQSRIDEVQAASVPALREYAAHHFSRALDQNVAATEFAVRKFLLYASAPKPRRQQLRAAAEEVFRSCHYAERLDPGLAAITRIAGGALHPELRGLHRRILRTIEKMEGVRRRFYSRSRQIDLGGAPALMREIGGLCAALDVQIVALYEAAKARYHLPALNGGVER